MEFNQKNMRGNGNIFKSKKKHENKYRRKRGKTNNYFNQITSGKKQKLKHRKKGLYSKNQEPTFQN